MQMEREAFIFFSEIFGTLSASFFFPSVCNSLPVWHMGQICKSASHLQGGGCLLLYFRARGMEEWGRDGWKFRIDPHNCFLLQLFAQSLEHLNPKRTGGGLRSSWYSGMMLRLLNAGSSLSLGNLLLLESEFSGLSFNLQELFWLC